MTISVAGYKDPARGGPLPRSNGRFSEPQEPIDKALTPQEVVLKFFDCGPEGKSDSPADALGRELTPQEVIFNYFDYPDSQSGSAYAGSSRQDTEELPLARQPSQYSGPPTYPIPPPPYPIPGRGRNTGKLYLDGDYGEAKGGSLSALSAFLKRITGFFLEKKRIFISYRRSDTKQIAGRICDRLIQKFGRDAVFMDIDNIPAGADFHEFIDETVAKADAVVLLIGDGWVSAADDRGSRRLDNPNDFVRIEIEMALKRKVPIIPVLIDGAAMPREEQLPGSLHPLLRKNAVPVDAGRDFHSHMDRLIPQLGRYLEGKSSS